MSTLYIIRRQVDHSRAGTLYLHRYPVSGGLDWIWTISRSRAARFGLIQANELAAAYNASSPQTRGYVRAEVEPVDPPTLTISLHQ